MNARQSSTKHNNRLQLVSARMAITSVIGLLACVSPEWIASKELGNFTMLLVKSSRAMTSAGSPDVINHIPETDEAMRLHKKTVGVSLCTEGSSNISFNNNASIVSVNSTGYNCSRSERHEPAKTLMHLR